MQTSTITPAQDIQLFVKNILLLTEEEDAKQTRLPFYADGYPGLMYHNTHSGLLVNPHNKTMPRLFLYGQTLQPIELVIDGAYRLLVFQLYPFVLKSFFNVQPELLNDACYDIAQLPGNTGNHCIQQLQAAKETEEQIQIMTRFLLRLFQQQQAALDLVIADAVQKIITFGGQLSIKDLCNELHLHERTLQRRFFNAVGVTAKQFASIIQFQQSFEQLTDKKFNRLTDIVYHNGFADQSHFIKVFKAFTGKTPLAFRSHS
ncbi:MAG TPA: AraC family transcriptional regulator [Chitinophagaceae bacterium]|nr:AraC family transcriptional regulator [Chitinophagaceae bacterium]